MYNNILINIVIGVAGVVAVIIFYFLFSLWLACGWLRDHGPDVSRSLFIFLAGKKLI